MKTLKLSIAMLLVTTFQMFAQKPDAKASQDYPSNFLNLGFGLGTPYWSAGFKNTLPINPTLTYEHRASSPSVNPVSGEAVNELLSLLKNNLTIGGSIAYSGSKQEFNSSYYNYDVKYTAIFASVRSSFHFLKSGPIDPYAGIGLGYVIVSAKVSSSYSGTYTATGTSGIGYSFYGGIRYMPSKRVGFYGELGYTSLAILNLGVTFKL